VEGDLQPPTIRVNVTCLRMCVRAPALGARSASAGTTSEPHDNVMVLVVDILVAAGARPCRGIEGRLHEVGSKASSGVVPHVSNGVHPVGG
jgi:hypothetical protein